MLFNSTYKLGKLLPDISQDEILNTPSFYYLSLEQITKHQDCPKHLKTVLNAMDWVGRPNFIQVRVQDCRMKIPQIRGSFWHLDLDTHLANGRIHLAKSLDEFRSMTASFGGVVEAEFIKDPIELDIKNPYNHSEVCSAVHKANPKTVSALTRQLATYTSRDIHRAGVNYRKYALRLIIVSVECDEPLEDGAGFTIPAIKI